MPSEETEEEKTEEEVTREDIKNLVEMFAHLLDAYGSFANSLGKIQKTHEEAYETMFSLELAESLPEILSIVSEKGPPELSKLLTKIFVKMATLLPRIGKLMDLPANEKIKLGKNLKSLAKDFEKLIEHVEKMEEK